MEQMNTDMATVRVQGVLGRESHRYHQAISYNPSIRIHRDYR